MPIHGNVAAEWSREDRAFLGQAVEACDRAGNRAVLLLVGSRAAGFACRGSDLDLWIIGDATSLPTDQRREHDVNGDLFVDRGDFGAHWHFYDEQRFADRLRRWPSEMMWILATAQFLHGRRETFDNLYGRFTLFPREVAEPKLKWLVGLHHSLPSPMWVAGIQGRMAGSFAMAGQAVDTLCKICCVAECKPWPYRKWLTKVAQSTRAGQILYPYADRCVQAFLEVPKPSADQPSREWPPRKVLMQATDALPAVLHALGWQADWVTDSSKAAAETLLRESP